AGSVVTKGEVIARLDPRDYQNALDSAQARYDEARQNLMRTRTLRSQSVTTEAELDSADATYETAEAELRTSWSRHPTAWWQGDTLRTPSRSWRTPSSCPCRASTTSRFPSRCRNGWWPCGATWPWKPCTCVSRRIPTRGASPRCAR
ncbi:hypothetical protein DQK91_23000, partial [Oceanidesulfovibrio marinus]